MGAADRRRRWPAAVLTSVALLSAACGSRTGEVRADPAAPVLPQGSEPVELDPADFSSDVTHPWWPMAPGDRWVYEETDADGTVQRVEVTVLDETRVVPNGVEARVVHDVVTTADGALVEDTLDWYAQDADGALWYLGEQTAEYEDGVVVSTAGSWEAGVDGAQAGVLLPADPSPGLSYRQEHLAGEAEDEALVLSADETVQAPAGSWTGALLTRDTTPLEPDVSELKFYAPGIGPVLVLQVSGGTGREALVESTRG
ncbi:hypothetical protein GCM10027451_12370 [Geodermatophilus aquaeductus]|uniref:Lipoprotein n=1 Tax=Geodermatophilus aquaeductus TaxID=1564161 RepID=A0A521B340_9ACTN|nr:hypothetical protein [Geodermatophilus aquaeductus]SMO41503.1 hypothetical protein SAMN06273567_101529 [Geodermatophilus aquaeductus]